MSRRVVVTGLGAVTPIGNNVDDFWAAVKAGKIGFDHITKFDTTDYKCHIAAELKACLLYTSPSPRDGLLSRMPSSA